MKKTSKRRFLYFLPALLLAMGSISSCNKSGTTIDDSVVVTISNVAVRNFSLKSDSKVMANLDSVFFSIDLKNGVIFNADSLPKGSNIRKLVPVITFSSTVSAAELVYEDQTAGQKKVDYLTNSTDSIDFTNGATLNVTAADGTNKYTYRIKVNVHEQAPDSLIWDRLSHTSLPSRSANPADQKSIEKGGTVYTLIEENDGTYTWAVASSLDAADWTKKELALPFVPAVRSLTSTADSFWILDAEGNLYKSENGEDWTPTGEKWVTLIGAYKDCVLGVKDSGGAMTHCHYPALPGISDPEMNPEFPLYARSEFRTIETKWSEYPTGFFVGGLTSSGERSRHTWAFDGTTWATIDATSMPALEGASLFEYIIYRKTSSSFRQVAYDAWVVLGGVLEDGSYNRKLYYSFDNGVTWRESTDMMSLPDTLPSLSECDVIVMNTALDANLSDAWTRASSVTPSAGARISYTLDGYDITWECPYIYLMGGRLTGGQLSDSIWRGVLARLAFTPII